MNYSEKLLDPKWKEKRRQIIDRDGGACIFCKDRERLEIHHAYYIAKREPWEYPDECLVTLCHDCHGTATERYAKEFAIFETAACAVLKAVRTNK